MELFAGAGGLSEGLRAALGLLDVLALDNDGDAVATARAAGHLRVEADVTRFPLRHGHGCEGLAAAGYRGWCGVVNAVDYSTPQDRPRAVLLARRDGRPVGPPPRHLVRVSAAAALGWRPADQFGLPRRADPGQHAVEWNGQLYRERDLRRASQPSHTVTGKARSWQRWTRDAHGRPVVVPVELAEASVLQGFRADYPWRGSRSQRFQVLANATPPPLARALVRHVTR